MTPERYNLTEITENNPEKLQVSQSLQQTSLPIIKITKYLNELQNYKKPKLTKYIVYLYNNNNQMKYSKLLNVNPDIHKKRDLTKM